MLFGERKLMLTKIWRYEEDRQNSASPFHLFLPFILLKISRIFEFGLMEAPMEAESIDITLMNRLASFSLSHHYLPRLSLSTGTIISEVQSHSNIRLFVDVLRGRTITASFSSLNHSYPLSLFILTHSSKFVSRLAQLPTIGFTGRIADSLV